jgi:TnpA family transposase
MEGENLVKRFMATAPQHSLAWALAKVGVVLQLIFSCQEATDEENQRLVFGCIISERPAARPDPG